jgi:hypothetical protein
MTIKELEQYQKNKAEALQLQDIIKSLENSLSSNSIVITDGNRKSKISIPEKLAFKLIELNKKLEKKLNLILIEQRKIENYLDTIEVIDIRLIIRKKFIENKTWEEVGRELHEDRTTSYYKLKTYLKKQTEKEKIYDRTK